MKVRRIAGFLPVLVALGGLSTGHAQTTPGHEWNPNRPDSRAPISLIEDRTLQAGQLELSLKYINERYGGLGLGGDSLFLEQVLKFNTPGFYSVAPTEMVSQGAEVNLMFGVTRHLTLSASASFVQKKMELAVSDPTVPARFWLWDTKAVGPEDVRVSALYNVFDQGGVRIHVQGGVSIPVGAIDYDDEMVDPATLDPNAGSYFTVNAILPYRQQLGSGTFDVLPGVTASVQNEVASVGVQAKAVIRMGDNDRGWALGDVYTGTVWGAYNVSDWAALTAGVRYTTWGNVEGFDPSFFSSASFVYDNPAYNNLQAGSRIEVPLGVNFLVSEGRFSGHRFGVEFLPPVDQDLDYTQSRRDWNLVLGWQKAISF